MKRYSSPVLHIVFWVIMAAFSFIVLYNLSIMPVSNNSILHGSDMKWYYQESIPVDFNDPNQFAREVNRKNYVLSCVFDSTVINDCLAFKTDFADVEIRISGKSDPVYSTFEHYSNGKKPWFPFSGYTPQMNFVNLNASKGDKVTIYVQLYYSEKNSGISDIMYGQSDQIIDAVFLNDMLGIFLCVALFVTSLIMLVYHCAFRKVIMLKGLKYAACFAIIASLNAISGSTALAALAIAGGTELYTINFLSYSAMFAPLILFFAENTKFRKSDIVLKTMFVIQTLITIAVCVLAHFGVADLYQTHLPVELAGYVQCMIILGVLLADYFKRRDRKVSDVMVVIFYAVLFAGVVWNGIFGSDSTIPIIWIICCLIFMIAVMTVSMTNIAQTLKLSAEAEAIGKMAFTDGLTEVGNTAAFQKKLSHLEVIKINYKAIAIVQFDVNNLKAVNDNLGHEMGDLLITDGSAIIKKAFERVGDIYRVGGDEFVAVVCGDNAMADCSSALNQFDAYIDKYNDDDSHRFILQVAYGVDFYRPDDPNVRHMTLKEIQKSADAKMYEKKREMKKHITKEQVLKLEPIISNEPLY